MKGENIQKLLDLNFPKFASAPHQGDLRAIACEGNDRWKLKAMTKHHLCKENNLPIVVFDMDTPGNLAKVIAGEPIGTLVY